MGFNSWAWSLALGVVLTLALAAEVSRPALAQESPEKAANPPDQQAAAGGQKQATDQANGTGQSVSPGGGKQESKGKSGKNVGQTGLAAEGASPIHKAAAQMLESLDAATSLQQKSGALPPGKTASDLAVRRNELQQKARTAKDDNAWAEVAAGAAAALTDTMKFAPANSPDPSGNARGSGAPAENRLAAGVPPDPELGGRYSALPLYMASAALLLSVLALGGGWLLARREINRALSEAGLL